MNAKTFWQVLLLIILGLVGLYGLLYYRDYQAKRALDIEMCSSGMRMDEVCLDLIREGVDIKVEERFKAHVEHMKALGYDVD